MRSLPPTPHTYGELQRAYTHFNAALFGGRLRECLITLQRKPHMMGYFHPERFINEQGERLDEIALNPTYFAVTPIEDGLSTLVHEQVHLWQHHHGKPGRRGYHNKEWATQMQRVGLAPSTTGQPGGRSTGERVSHYVLAAGPFHLACRELLTLDFHLAWYDRFLPAVMPSLPAPATPPDSPPASGTPIAPAPAQLSAPPHATLSLPLTAHAARSPTRQKYRCPNCAAAAWGKRGLKLVCGTCQTPMT